MFKRSKDSNSSSRLTRPFRTKKENSTASKPADSPKKVKGPTDTSTESLAKATSASSDNVGVVPQVGSTIQALTALSDRIADFIIRNEPHEAPLSSGVSTDSKKASLSAMNEGFADIVAKVDELTTSLAHFADQDYARSDKQLNKTFQRVIEKERYNHFSDSLARELKSSDVDLQIRLKTGTPANVDALEDWDYQIKEEHETSADLVRITKFKYLLCNAFRQFTPYGALS